jgi:hypothetical protein
MIVEVGLWTWRVDMVSVASVRVWMGFDPRDRASQILMVVSALPG